MCRRRFIQCIHPFSKSPFYPKNWGRSNKKNIFSLSDPSSVCIKKVKCKISQKKFQLIFPQHCFEVGSVLWGKTWRKLIRSGMQRLPQLTQMRISNFTLGGDYLITLMIGDYVVWQLWWWWRCWRRWLFAHGCGNCTPPKKLPPSLGALRCFKRSVMERFMMVMDHDDDHDDSTMRLCLPSS